MIRQSAVVLVSLLSFLSVDARAQGAPPGCKTPMHRQFDFWLGEWTVTDSARTIVAGRNSVTLEDSGCTVHEHWVAGGSVPNTGQRSRDGSGGDNGRSTVSCRFGGVCW